MTARPHNLLAWQRALHGHCKKAGRKAEAERLRQIDDGAKQPRGYYNLQLKSYILTTWTSRILNLSKRAIMPIVATFGSFGDILSICLIIKDLVKAIDDSKGACAE